MGFVGLPVSIFLYWLMLRPKKEAPFPKYGLFRLFAAALISVIVSSLVTVPVAMVISLLRAGVFSDFSGFIEVARSNPEYIKEVLGNLNTDAWSAAIWSIITMFFSAGLLEEGLKYLTCRAAIRKKGMIVTWMDCVISFAIVGLTFELIENVIFGMNEDLLGALWRSFAPAHYVFGVIMGYYYGKYLITKQKKYHWLSFFIPVIYHSLANGFMNVIDESDVLYYLGIISSASFIAAGIITVIIVLYWQKNKTLDVPIDDHKKELQV